MSNISYKHIKNNISKECFEISTTKSLYYFIKDIIIIIILYSIKNYMFENLFLYFIWSNFLGLMLFSLFVIGHDCSHGTFSKNIIINNIIGHLCHGFILVPFWPWKKSHYIHHFNHNNIDKDIGHPWVLYENESILFKIFNNNPIFIPFSYPYYLIFGINNDSHYWPGSHLFKNFNDKIKCIISVFSCLIFFYIIQKFFDNVIYSYYIPYFIYNTWLYMVSYLQHHDENTKVYDDENWNFIKGAFETIDRTYGLGIDYLIHNLTNGHVVHHLFFNKIPHYHLMKATSDLKKIVNSGYKHKDTKFYIWEIIKRHSYKYRWKLFKNEEKYNSLKS